MPASQILKINYHIPIVESVGQPGGEFFIKGIAINETTTRNGHIFKAEELEKSAQTLIHKPILKDHDARVDSIVGKVVDSKYNKATKNVEFTARIMDVKMQEMISDGRISNVSVGAWPGETEETDEGLVIKGIDFLELSLVAIPADPNAALAKMGFSDFGSVMCESLDDIRVHKGEEKRMFVALINVMEQESTTVQTLIFSKEKFSKEAAVSWAKDHDFRSDKVDETEDSFRFRQRDPNDFKEGSFRTIELSSGIQAVIGKLKESLEDSKKKNGGMKMENQNESAVLDAIKQLTERVDAIGKIQEMPMPKDEDELKAVCKKMMSEESAKEIAVLNEEIASLKAAVAAKEPAKVEDKTKGIVVSERADEERGMQNEQGLVIEGSARSGHSIWRMPGEHGELVQESK